MGFQSTLPARGATTSQMALRCPDAFQSTLPARGATKPPTSTPRPSAYFNPRSPHGERPVRRDVPPPCVAISIHAPRTGSDAFPCPASRAYSNFNPRSPHGERRGGTQYLDLTKDFNPRSPHGERLIARFSIVVFRSFQSTLPARGATSSAWQRRRLSPISIHAPRTGSDARLGKQRIHEGQFQSTLPARGATSRLRHSYPAGRHFNPRSPHGERLYPNLFPAVHAVISIHAPRTGSDKKGFTQMQLACNFNPRSPHGERPCCLCNLRIAIVISIHAPRTGSDFTSGKIE